MSINPIKPQFNYVNPAGIVLNSEQKSQGGHGYNFNAKNTGKYDETNFSNSKTVEDEFENESLKVVQQFIKAIIEQIKQIFLVLINIIFKIIEIFEVVILNIFNLSITGIINAVSEINKTIRKKIIHPKIIQSSQIKHHNSIFKTKYLN